MASENHHTYPAPVRVLYEKDNVDFDHVVFDWVDNLLPGRVHRAF